MRATRISSKRRPLILGAGALLALPLLIGCQSDARTGALVGTGAGAAAGQAIGGDTESTLIGAGAGAVGGYLIGEEIEKTSDETP